MALRTREAMAGSLITSQRSWPRLSTPLQYAQTLPSSSTMASKNGAYAKHRSAATDFRHLRGSWPICMLAPASSRFCMICMRRCRASILSIVSPRRYGPMRPFIAKKAPAAISNQTRRGASFLINGLQSGKQLII